MANDSGILGFVGALCRAEGLRKTMNLRKHLRINRIVGRMETGEPIVFEMRWNLCGIDPKRREENSDEKQKSQKRSEKFLRRHLDQKDDLFALGVEPDGRSFWKDGTKNISKKIYECARRW